MKCKTCNQEVEEISKPIKIKERGIEITSMKEYTGKYNEIVSPKGYELISVSNLLWIWDNKKYREIVFKDYFKNPSLIIIACKQLWNDVTQDRSRWLFLDRGLYVYSVWDYLDGSSSGGRVIFCRELK